MQRIVKHRVLQSLSAVRLRPSFRKQALHTAGGILFTAVLALLGLMLSVVPGLRILGPLTWTILLAALFRQLWGYPDLLRSGIQFSSKKLLRYAIVLYGLKLNMSILFSQGPGLLLRDAAAVIFAIGVTLFIAKRLKADFSLSLLLGIGTGVCGAAAIAAAAPILKARDEDTALGAGMIAFVGTLFAVIYTILLPLLPLSPQEYGMWAGISLHELAQVALAAAPAGEDALTVSLLAKLGRVFLLIPLCFVLVILMRRRGASGSGDTRPAFPWFLVGFTALSLAGSFEMGDEPLLSGQFKESASMTASFLLAMAMAGLGLQIHLKTLSKAWRPLLAMTLSSILLSLLALWMV
ncbi:YeiH family protein [Paenibacillus lemnae]|uniref:Putative sulfate exporter family transporter n=1 Tax=Paenibacillus lemnae TaxID=1330551 RepID=A0A848M3L7_PAELE|nr:putative sulfate exporter family transporter [Paenibacillus lemnae]NMO94433.1 putative sulfate exporter family transporter [Paenibacillus lemnae]